jgi:hypothetical protein
MIYKLETIDRVINKIIRDLGLGQDEIPYPDFVEWIAAALEHIGTYYQYVEKECLINIVDYSATLPCDFYKPIRMKRGCTINADNGTYYRGSFVNLLTELGIDVQDLPAYEQYHIVQAAAITSGHPIDTIVEKLQGNKNLIGNVTVNKFTDSDYNVNLNKITTSFRYGIIQLQYLAIPIDERGFPYVPDDEAFRDALFWKVAYQISMRNPKLLSNQRMQDMEYCRQMWDKYCGQARGSANMPNLEMMIRIKNNWLRLYNKTDDDVNDFANLGKQQKLDLRGRV